jgi:2-polyprenyl-6-methoxyphenol hydroxylase-like FAD-dependent oxidoreductase
MRILMVGAGMVGLCAGMLLADDGHDVTLVERDPAPPPDPGQAWSAWERRGVNQFRLPNFLLSRFRLTAESELPRLTHALTLAGACRYNMIESIPASLKGGARPDDQRFDLLTGRRPVVEAATARVAAATRGLTVRRGAAVRNLVLGPSALPGTPHVTGVELESGERLEADLVVDATGRRSPLPRWIGEAGGRPPHEELEDSGFKYFARHFRSDEGLPVVLGPLVQEYGSISALTLPADGGTWSVSIVTSSRDTALRGLAEPHRWRAAVETLPGAAHWIDAEPIDDRVTVITRIEDRIRDYGPGGAPVATGVLAVGDSWSCTNPSLGRGASVGLLHAVLLRDVLRAGACDGPGPLASTWWEATRTEMEPWYRATLTYDRHRLAQVHAEIEGAAYATDDAAWNRTRALQARSVHDGDLLRASLDMAMLLRPTAEVLTDPAIRRKVDDAGPAGGSPLAGPTRDELITAIR